MGFHVSLLTLLFLAIIELGICMERAALGSHGNDVAEVKTVKCSMCRKVKTRDHFINPNSDSLFHVCDYCRYLRKTKYKSRNVEWVWSEERRVRVELEKPSGASSRSRESAPAKGVVIVLARPKMSQFRQFQWEQLQPESSLLESGICVSTPVEQKNRIFSVWFALCALIIPTTNTKIFSPHCALRLRLCLMEKENSWTLVLLSHRHRRHWSSAVVTPYMETVLVSHKLYVKKEY